MHGGNYVSHLHIIYKTFYVHYSHLFVVGDSCVDAKRSFGLEVLPTNVAEVRKHPGEVDRLKERFI